jgi:acetylxylan esterase
MLVKSILAGLAALPAALAAAGQLVRITENFGPNPNGVLFYLYAPPKLQARPPILVIPHYCTGTAQAVFGGTQQIVSAADTYGFIIIYPEANRSGKCWDLSSTATLKHDAGGDSLGIASAVRWTLTKYNANPSRVFSYGGSSGAMMTNVLMGAYPDLFAGGSAWAGVPFGCYGDVGGTATWSSNCAQGKRIMTGAQWKALVDAAYPG